MTALQVGTVFAAVNIISDGVSSLPLHVYQRAKIAGRNSKNIAVDSPLYKLINQEPNPEMTSAVFLKTLMVHDLLWGNAYAEIQKNNSGQIIGIWPRNPARTRPIRILKPLLLGGDVLEPGTLLYETSDQLMDSSSYVVDQNPDQMNVGLRRLVLAENMIHIPGLSLDGRLGQSTVWLARQAFGLALATEKYGAKFFGNGARPAGILTLPNKLEEKAIDTLRRSWAEAHGGENQFKVAVLEQGVKYEKIAATPEEGQMLETRKYEREEICAIFGVPAHMVCAQEKGGKSNVEQSSIEFVLYCLHPWLNRFEQEFGRKLFSDMGRSAGKYFAKFDVRKLMYPDAAARSTFYAQGKQWGFLNTNMILELEDMNPVEDPKVGETFWQPINMQDAGDPQKLGASDQNQLDIQKATAVAEHAAQMQQDTAKVTTNLQMKTAEQAHGHAMEAAKESNKHTQTMTKLGALPSQNTPGASSSADAGNELAAGADNKAPADKKVVKRFAKIEDVQRAMAEAYDEDFIFVTATNAAEGRSYRYANVDGRELYIIYETRGDDEHDAAGKFASKGSGAATGMAAKHAVITSPAVHAQMVAAYKQAQPTFRPKITATAGTLIPHNEYSFTVDKDGKPSGVVTSGTEDKNTVVVPDGAQAVVHTHPSADHPYPSDADIAYAKSTGVPDYVISSNELWVANPDGTSEKVADIEMKHGDLQIKWNK